MKLSAVSAGVLLSAAAANATVIYDNTFGTETAGSPPAGWYRSDSTGTTTINVGTDAVSGIPANKQAESVSVGVATKRSIQFNFVDPTYSSGGATPGAPISLNDGDSIKLTVLLRATSITTSARTFRFALMNDAGTHVTADGNSGTNGNNATTLGDDNGYTFRLNTGTSTANDGTADFDVDRFTSNGTGSPTVTQLATDPNASNPRSRDGGETLNDSVQHTLTLTLTRSGTTMLGSATYDNTTVSGMDNGTLAGNPSPVTAFNSVLIQHQVAINYFIDEIKVETIPATTSPEPASLGLACVGLVAFSRRRRK